MYVSCTASNAVILVASLLTLLLNLEEARLLSQGRAMVIKQAQIRPPPPPAASFDMACEEHCAEAPTTAAVAAKNV